MEKGTSQAGGTDYGIVDAIFLLTVFIFFCLLCAEDITFLVPVATPVDISGNLGRYDRVEHC